MLRGVVIAAAAVAAIAGTIFVASAQRSNDPVVRISPGQDAAQSTYADGVSESSAAVISALIEVPKVVGLTLEQARALCGAGSLALVAHPSPAGETTPGIVLSQDPPPGKIVSRDATLTVWYASDDVLESGSSTTRDPESLKGSRFVVCIDPGHQARPNLAPEPIGPGSTKTSPKVAAGAVGVVTRQGEAQVSLLIALELQRLLEARGIRVVLTRTTDAVDISNAARARIANESRADLYIRVHADADTNGDISGVRTLYPAGNEWVAGISAASRRAAEIIQQSLVEKTGAFDRGTSPRSDLAGFNWSKVPVVLVQCGCLSNPVEDRRLATRSYRAAVAEGIAAGVLEYLED